MTIIVFVNVNGTVTCGCFLHDRCKYWQLLSFTFVTYSGPVKSASHGYCERVELSMFTI